MIKVYGSPRSSAGRVYWTLEELSLGYEHVKINMSEKEHKAENFLKLNPNGKIPHLTDGTFNIWESVAIVNYLADKYRPELLGATAEIRGTAQQWSIWAILELQKPLIDILIQKVFVPEDKRNHALIEKSERDSQPLLIILDKALENRKFIAGDTFTVADINLASVIGITWAIPMDISAFKNVKAYMQHMMDRPGFQKYSKLLN